MPPLKNFPLTPLKVRPGLGWSGVGWSEVGDIHHLLSYKEGFTREDEQQKFKNSSQGMNSDAEVKLYLGWGERVRLEVQTMDRAARKDVLDMLERIEQQKQQLTRYEQWLSSKVRPGLGWVGGWGWRYRPWIELLGMIYWRGLSSRKNSLPDTNKG